MNNDIRNLAHPFPSTEAYKIRPKGSPKTNKTVEVVVDDEDQIVQSLAKARREREQRIKELGKKMEEMKASHDQALRTAEERRNQEVGALMKAIKVHTEKAGLLLKERDAQIFHLKFVLREKEEKLQVYTAKYLSMKESKNKPYEGLNAIKELSKELNLECPVCMEQWNEKRRPKVFQCGHLICEVCISDVRITICPICRNDGGSPSEPCLEYLKLVKVFMKILE